MSINMLILTSNGGILISILLSQRQLIFLFFTQLIVDTLKYIQLSNVHKKAKMLYSTKKRNWNRRTHPLHPHKKHHLICLIGYQNSYTTPSRIFRCARIFRELRIVYTWGSGPTSPENFMYVLWYKENTSIGSCNFGFSWNTVLNSPKAYAHPLAQSTLLVSKKMPSMLLFRKWHQKQTHDTCSYLSR